jgi:NADH dehydrogenase (ubiquinone) Fe-S protein 3
MNNKNNLLYTSFGNYLNKIIPGILYTETFFKNELILTVPSFLIQEILLILRDHTNTQFKVLSDICAVDFLKKKKSF